jgi:predicted enzyme related to lactoylglutathione lyase
MTILAMTKIIVTNLDRSEAFYRAVCGFDQVERISGDGFIESIMRPAGNPMGGALVLFADGTAPPPGEAVLVFETDDVEAFAARSLSAGGETTLAPQFIAELGVTVAMFCDPEGHTIEAISRHAPEV